jgi:hypothetical protein
MKILGKFGGSVLAAAVLASVFFAKPAAAQDPITTPIIIDTAVPIIINAVKPKPSGLTKFEGTYLNGSIAQITLKAKGNDMAIQTFTLSKDAAAKMQVIVDKGGYQYGDKVTLFYDPATVQVIKFKGKPSKPV